MAVEIAVMAAKAVEAGKKVAEVAKKAEKVVSTVEKPVKAVEKVTADKDGKWGADIAKSGIQKGVGVVKNDLADRLKDYLVKDDIKVDTPESDKEVGGEQNDINENQEDTEPKEDKENIRDKLNKYLDSADSPVNTGENVQDGAAGNDDDKILNDVQDDDLNQEKKDDKIDEAGKESKDKLNKHLDSTDNQEKTGEDAQDGTADSSDSKVLNDVQGDDLNQEKDNNIDEASKESDENNDSKADNEATNEVKTPEYNEDGTRELTEDEKEAIKEKLGWSDQKIKKCTIDKDGVIHYKTDRCDLEGKTSENGVPYERRRIVINGVVIEGVFPKFNSYFDTELSPDKWKTKAYAKECNAALKEAIQNDPELRSKFTAEQIKDIEADRTPTGYVWHHNEEPGKMQLVKREDHDRTIGGAAHTGGNPLWGADSVDSGKKGEHF